MVKEKFEINGKLREVLFFENEKKIKSDTVFLYFHGLEGKAKLCQPLQKQFTEYDFISVEQRGHQESNLPPSITIKKHVEDYLEIIEFYKTKYKKVFLLGESMGATYLVYLSYLKQNLADGIFAWSIPIKPKDIMDESVFRRSYIIFRVIFSFFTQTNWKYYSKIKYSLLTNSPTLLRLSVLENQTQRQTKEAISLWKTSLFLQSWLRKTNPLNEIYYFHGTDDKISDVKFFQKAANKKMSNIHFNFIDGGYHILMFDPKASEMFEQIKKILENKIS